ncbi:uncharacterized protein LOC143219896 [Lasioglossum baleicum]|uniref:uncharacterized protein LOC143219896 n=1 Tax=Lasioglossum baleicum TaxID=434251 RepID=UPI003FCD461B
MVLSDGTITLLKPHNHPGQEYIATQHFMIEEMMKLSRETLIPFKQIFDDEQELTASLSEDSRCSSAVQYGVGIRGESKELIWNSRCTQERTTICNAAAYCSFTKLRPTLHRQRANFKPTIPQSLEILYDQMKTYQPLEKLKISVVKSLKDEFAVIITTDGLLEGLKNSKEIFVDGTFAVLPKKPHMGQLYTIHIRYMDNGIATILVLCETRTAAMYTAIWKQIFTLIPELPNNIRFIMSDYEAAAVTTLNELFPNAHIHGCWFHYCQAILRKWRKLGLTNVPNTVLRMSMSLALVPETKFQEALLIIQKEADNIASNFPNVLLFMTYMRINWLKMASQVSVYNCPVRTNNIAESFHNVAGQKLGKQNINVWAFLEKIRDLLMDQELDLNRLQNGVASRKPRTRENISRRKKIAKAQAEFDTGRLSLEEFLNIFHHKDTIFKINQISALAGVTSWRGYKSL